MRLFNAKSMFTLAHEHTNHFEQIEENIQKRAKDGKFSYHVSIEKLKGAVHTTEELFKKHFKELGFTVRKVKGKEFYIISWDTPTKVRKPRLIVNPRPLDNGNFKFKLTIVNKDGAVYHTFSEGKTSEEAKSSFFNKNVFENIENGIVVQRQVRHYTIKYTKKIDKDAN